MEDPSSLMTAIASLAMFLLISLRILNNTLKASFYGISSISVIAMAKRIEHTHPRLYAYLENPALLSLSAQLIDKIGLAILLACVLIVRPSIGPVDLAIFAGYMILADLMIPNIIASFDSESAVLRLFPILRMFYDAFFPLTSLIKRMSQFTMTGSENEDEDEDEDLDDIRAFIQAGTQEGYIEEDETSMLANLLAFNDTIAREIMTPRTDMICIDVNDDLEHIINLFKTTKHSRIPAYDSDIDNIIGVLRFKDIMEISEGKQPLREFLSRTIFVPEGKNVDDLLRDMLRERIQMVIVVDEYGGTSGLITMENLVEEIVGDIHEEHEDPNGDDVVDLQDGSYLVDGRVLLEEFSQLFNVEISDPDVDTIAGYIFTKAGFIPKVGETFDLGEGIRSEIAEADDRRIFKIKVTPPTPVTVPLH